jgi:hypothetical protein
MAAPRPAARREIDVGTVLENRSHLGQAVTGDRSRVIELRQSDQRSFDQIRNSLLRLDGRVTRRGCVDLDLHIGDVRYSVNRQAFVVIDTQDGRADHECQHQPAVLEAV